MLIYQKMLGTLSTDIYDLACEQ